MIKKNNLKVALIKLMLSSAAIFLSTNLRALPLLSETEGKVRNCDNL